VAKLGNQGLIGSAPPYHSPHWKSGAYIVILRARHNGQASEQEAFFTLRAVAPGRKAKIALVLATSTWQAYSNWGGASSYTNANADAGCASSNESLFSMQGKHRDPHLVKCTDARF